MSFAESEAEFEEEAVHAVYEQISEHFCATRHKPWPIVQRFVDELPAGSLVVDVGCGNGKYLSPPGQQGAGSGCFSIGCDRSSKLIAGCARGGHEVLVCDNFALPFRDEAFDFALSIAVLHHFCSEERRRKALMELLRIVRRGGRLLVFVWAQEQEHKTFERQDVMVPWYLQRKFRHNVEKDSVGEPIDGESVAMGGEEPVPSDGEVVVRLPGGVDVYSTAMDRGPVARKRGGKAKEGQAIAVKEHQVVRHGGQVFRRYYHLFRAGELEELCAASGAQILESGFHCDNHFVLLLRVS